MRSQLFFLESGFRLPNMINDNDKFKTVGVALECVRFMTGDKQLGSEPKLKLAITDRVYRPGGKCGRSLESLGYKLCAST